MRFEVTTTATSGECRALRPNGTVQTERAFLVDADNKMKAVTAVKVSVSEKVLRVTSAPDDEVTVERERRAVARAIARHVTMEHPSPVEMLMNGESHAER